LCTYNGIADLAGVETPVIDKILAHFQGFMGKEYLKDGKLAGKVVGETRYPERYGKYTLGELLADRWAASCRWCVVSFSLYRYRLNSRFLCKGID